MPREHFNATEQALLAPYVTNLDRPVFALQHLPEEVVAVLFAYYSRSRDSLRRNLLKLISEGDLALLGHQPGQRRPIRLLSPMLRRRPDNSTKNGLWAMVTRPSPSMPWCT